MIPLLLPVALSGISTGVSIGYTILDLYHKNQRARENERYWNDYFKNTGLGSEDIRYPYKAGYMDSYLSDLQNSYAGFQFISSNLGKLYK